MRRKKRQRKKGEGAVTGVSIKKTVCFFLAVVLVFATAAKAFAESQKTENAILQNQEMYRQTGNAGIIVRPTNIRYPYGEGTPTFYCAVMEICEVSFLPNDVPTIKLIGDSSDWPTAWWIGTTPQGRIYHMDFKPYPTAQKTNVVIGMQNDRRYMFNLVIVPSERLRVHSYSFYDPGSWAVAMSPPMPSVDTNLAKREEEKVARLEKQLDHVKLQDHGISIDPRKLESMYRVEGEAPWKPVAVFDDGSRVFIQFPETVDQHYRPAFFMLGRGGEVMSSPQKRVSRTLLVIPHLFSRGALIWGAGVEKREIKIFRMKSRHKKPWWNPF